MLVNENDDATAYLTLEELSKLIEGSKFGGISHADINGLTDIVIIADLTREKDWTEGSKHAKILKQLSNKARDSKLRLIHFSDFLKMTPSVNKAVKEAACVSTFEGKLPPPGPQRTRGVCFARTLQSTDGRLNDKGKASQTGFYQDYFSS